jgi:hypothetical protein
MAVVIARAFFRGVGGVGGRRDEVRGRRYEVGGRRYEVRGMRDEVRYEVGGTR